MSPAPVDHVTNAACTASVVAGIFGWLPPTIAVVAGLLACIWYGLEIWDSRIVRQWRKHSSGE